MVPHARFRHPHGALHLSLLLTIAVAFTVAGCAHLFDRPDQDVWEVSSGSGTDITLDIQNDNFYDARVFARWNGERQRLGLVTGLDSEVFTMSGRTGDLRIEVDFVATRNYVSRSVSVSPGDYLTFRIPSRVP